MERTGKGALVLLVALCLCTSGLRPILAQDAAGGGAAAKGEVKTGAALEDAVEAASEAQEYQEEADKVVAQVVKQEPAVELAAGDGDLDTTGACATEIEQFCFEVKPGEGRLAKCIADQVKEEAKDGYDGGKTSEKCRTEVDGFKQDRASNINKDLPLAKACVADADKLCKDLDPDTSVLACLRAAKDDLSSECSSVVFERQSDAADDWRTDKELYEACKVDAEGQCKGVEEHDGQIQECLRKKRAVLSWDCQEQLFRQEVENADDLRLSVRLFKKCLDDKRKFCADIQPGNARAKECLEEHREDAGFSEGCKAEIESMMEARAADFRLDPKLRELCADDIQEVCGYERDSLDSIAGYDARVIQCLQDYRDEIQSEPCKGRVHKIMQLASSDIRFDVPLADACYEDRQNFCGNVPPGSARVIRCLQDRREELSYECRATLFDQEVRMAENIDFQFPMKKACGQDIKRFCGSVPSGHAKVIRCLQDNIDQGEFSEECKTEVQKHVQHAAKDYRLNYRLSTACHDTIAEKCGDVCASASVEQPCGGTVLRCLTDKLEEITNEDCKKEVFYFEKMEVRDFRNDVILAEACRVDYESFCSKVEPGEGRVHACLRDNRAKLSEACRKEEIKLQIIESSNTELQPGLNKACKEERMQHCAGVRPGKARVFNCLLKSANLVDFSVQCKEQLMKQQERRVKDWRLDYDLRVGCKGDVAAKCAAATVDEDKETGAVLQCLVNNIDSLSDACARETARSVKNALQFYQPKMPVTGVCDNDVSTLCLENQQFDTGSIGKVRTCLDGLAGAQQEDGPDSEPTTASTTTEPAATDAQPAEDKAADAAASDTAAGADAEAPKEETKSRRMRMLLAEEPQKSQLSPACNALVQLAEPGDAYAAYQRSLSATAVATQLKKIETTLGFKEGTLTNKDAGITLTGWSALFGMFALAVVVFGAGIYGYRKYHGMDTYAGYTMVLKRPGHT